MGWTKGKSRKGQGAGRKRVHGSLTLYTGLRSAPGSKSNYNPKAAAAKKAEYHKAVAAYKAHQAGKKVK